MNRINPKWLRKRGVLGALAAPGIALSSGGFGAYFAARFGFDGAGPPFAILGFLIALVVINSHSATRAAWVGAALCLAFSPVAIVSRGPGPIDPLSALLSPVLMGMFAPQLLGLGLVLGAFLAAPIGLTVRCLNSKPATRTLVTLFWMTAYLTALSCVAVVVVEESCELRFGINEGCRSEISWSKSLFAGAAIYSLVSLAALALLVAKLRKYSQRSGTQQVGQTITRSRIVFDNHGLDAALSPTRSSFAKVRVGVLMGLFLMDMQLLLVAYFCLR